MSVAPDMATMTATTTNPLQPPPSGPLPPVPKTRRAQSETPEELSSRLRSPSPAAASRSGLPTPTRLARSISGLPTPKANRSRTSTPGVPILNPSESSSVQSTSPTRSNTPQAVSSAIPTPTKAIRKTTSFSSFPQPPPKATPRVPSLPPSPLSTSTSLSDVNGESVKASKSATTHRSADSGMKKPKSRSSGYGTKVRTSTTRLSGTTSLLNGNADDSLIASTHNGRGSDSLLSLPSPPQSRTSSADESYMTEATAFEDVGGSPPDRGRRKSKDSNMTVSTATTKRSSMGGKDSSKGNVIVSVRVRPDSGEGENPQGEWMVDGKRALISYSGREGGDYRYDNVFAPHDNNGRVYDSAAKRLVRRVMEGYHGTVFAYGMTGTGKTFSMQGTASSPGVIPLAITDIFSYIRENPSREFLLRVSYLEIYNEKIFDLLNQTTPGAAQEEIKLREDARRGVYATPLKEEIVQSPNQLLRVIARGDVARRTGSTQFNARSSRSHAVVQIVVESRERTPNHGQIFEKEARRSDKNLAGGVLVSTLSLIDLAGSEKAAESKERRAEGAHINKSLLTLGTVIGKLSGDDDKDKEKGGDAAAGKDKSLKHLPYRDSKLTRLLQGALSGNSLVSILCTVQLSSAGTSAASTTSHTGETLNTLKFASRAKNNIVSHAKKNESAVSDAKSQALLDRYRIEIQELRAQLEQQNKAKEDAEEKEELEEDRKAEEEIERQDRLRHEEQMLEMQLARTALKERIGHLNRLILSSKSLGVNSSSGRFSVASTINTRFSTFSTTGTDFGRPVSVRSRASSNSLNNRDSIAIADIPLPEPNSGRIVSSGSILQGMLPPAQSSRMVTDENSNGDEDEEDIEPGDADGAEHASLARQNRMLQADLADKNRYIATLEKRLLQARRTSNSRVSMGLAQSTRVTSPVMEEGEPVVDNALQEKDREIEELRAKLDDQMRMVTALRSAARKLDTTPAGLAARGQGQNWISPSVDDNNVAAALAMPPPPAPPRAGSRSSISHGHGTQSHRMSGRLSNGGIVNFSKTLSPMSAVAPSFPPSNSAERRPESIDSALGSPTLGNGAAKAPLSRRKSVDEMTMLLDQMIQEKVEAGSIVHSRTGSLRVKRDTMTERRGSTSLEDEKNGVSGPGRGPRLMDAVVLE
ncbi:Hypothetical protein R9X50_00658200 [Acrodontium crateriforme]|uniref:Kinesin-like protein KIP2 n=1 Tax=Acrodontium crateriforme TaxID=150365 RepID=A0AAQ3M956_9PEZI|nr:Hypothetical protein R9X50_00658200 [Acrodontium crateriforme]